MTPASIGGGNKPVSVAGVNPPLRYTLREDAQGFVSVLCQLTLTRFRRYETAGQLNDGGGEFFTFSGTPRRSCRDVRGTAAPSSAHVCDPPKDPHGIFLWGSLITLLMICTAC